MEIPELLRPCGYTYPDGATWGQWGTAWGYHFDERGIWTKGQVLVDGVPKGQHGGYDIACPTGTTLVSPVNGYVMAAGWQNAEDQKQGYGLRVMIESESPVRKADGSMFRPILTIGHFSELWIQKGALVKRGLDIGLSGATGNIRASASGNGAHLHAQLEIPGEYPRTPIQFHWVTV